MFQTLRNFKVLQAVGCVVTGFILYAIMDAIVKFLTQEFSLAEIIFYNAAFALIPICLLSYKVDGMKSLKTGNIKMQSFRGFVMFGATFCAFFGYSRMPLADAYAITFSVPFFVIIFSALLLKEMAGPRRWIAVIIGFVGVMFVAKPDHGVFSYDAFGPLGAAIGIALGIIIVRHLGKNNSSTSIAFYSNFVMTVLAVVFLYISSLSIIPREFEFFYLSTSFTMPNRPEFLLLAASGLLNGIADVFMFTAYKKASAPVLAPYQYTQVIWGMIVGYLVFGNVPDSDLLIGGGIVIVTGLYLIFHDTRSEKKLKNVPHQGEVMLSEDR